VAIRDAFLEKAYEFGRQREKLDPNELWLIA
jgi:hypothetical protein